VSLAQVFDSTDTTVSNVMTMHVKEG